MYELSSKAFTKMLLHAAKYPHLAINGIFIKKKGQAEAKTKTVVDCIPFFHHNLALLPMLEIALSQVETYCQENKMEICGYYQSQSNILDNRPDVLATKMLERLADNCGSVFLLMITFPNAPLQVENSKLNTTSEESPYKAYEWRDGRLASTSSVTVEAGALESSMNEIRTSSCQKLIDFDNHLDDVSLSWLNEDLL